MKKKILFIFLLVIIAFIGFRYYLIIKSVDYPVNRDPGWKHGDVFHTLPAAS